MSPQHCATIQKLTSDREDERRGKFRFPIRREVRYKLLREDAIIEVGIGETVDIGSGGIGFATGAALPIGAFIELSVSWPVLLNESCPMRLNVLGRVVRSEPGLCACTVDRYEYRIQSRGALHGPRHDSTLQRWAGEILKARAVTA